MPFHIQTDPDLIRLSYTGHVTQAELFASARQVETLEATLPDRPNQLTDLGGITSRETNYGNLSSVASIRRAKIFPNNFKLAMVAPTAESFGLARMFQSLADNPKVDIQIFPNKDEAEKWLAAWNFRA